VTVPTALVRGRRTYATGSASVRSGLARVTLAGRWGLTRGSYTVMVTARHGRASTVKRVKLKLG